MKVNLHIITLRSPQVGSFIKSSFCLSITKDDGQNVATFYLDGMEKPSWLISEGHYSGRVDFSVVWNSPIIRIDAHGSDLSILHLFSSTKNGIDPIYVGLCSTLSDSLSICDTALHLIEALLQSYEVESVDMDIYNG